jgi:hypothetical protein
MNPEKYLYEFSLQKEEEREKVEISKNELGEEIKILKKEIVKKPLLFRIVKPTRKVFDQAELFYGVKLSEGIKSGLLTRSLLAKRYQNDGGALSEPEKERYAALYIELFQKETELQRLQVNLDKLSEEEQKEKISIVLNSLLEIRKELQEFEYYQSNLFDQTAENRARNQTIIWWVLNISYIQKEKEFVSLFETGSFEERLAKYDEIEDGEDLFLKNAVKKFAYFISLWYVGRISNKEEFEYFDKNYENNNSYTPIVEKSEKDTKEEQK